MPNKKLPVDLPDPEMCLTVDGIIRDGQWVVLCCPYCARVHVHELGPPPVEGLREVPCKRGVPGERVYYYVRNAEVGFLPGLYAREWS